MESHCTLRQIHSISRLYADHTEEGERPVQTSMNLFNAVPVYHMVMDTS